MIKEKLSCWRCGKEVYSTSSFRAYCKECKEVIYKEREQQTNEYIIMKSKVMFENAMKSMEKQKLDMDYYQEACYVVKDLIERKPNTFDSSCEIMACIQLINNEVKVTPQYKIKNYTVDFYLPELKIILEIDGYNHNSSKNLLYDAKRDANILQELGSGWEVIRIKTTLIEKRLAFLLEQIKREYKSRQIYRKNYNGILPDNFSDSTKALYKHILEISKYNESYKSNIEIEEQKYDRELQELNND